MASNTTGGDIRTRSLKTPVDVAYYLFARLRELGVGSIHGVPGDYNLVALDYVSGAGLQWVGNCNELNAAYAADGYARVKGMGAIMTTFGVGELSAINGLAGAFSEMVPVVHIVGTPSTSSQRNGMLLHHTLGNGDFKVFTDMSRSISCVTSRLIDPSEIAGQIDHALRECYIRSRPVYLALPTDMVTKKIEGDRLNLPISLDEPYPRAPNETQQEHEEREDYVTDIILKTLHNAFRPCILVDACAVRHRVLPQVRALVEKTKLPVFVTPMGKGAVSEVTTPSFGGVYAGDASADHIREAVEKADLVVLIGALQSDFNTAGFSVRLSRLNTVDLHSTWCKVRYAEYPGVGMKGVLTKLTERVDLGKIHAAEPPALPTSKLEGEGGEGQGGDESPIRHEWLWERIGDGFLKENDIVVTETGTSNFGIWETRFPEGVTALNQVLWGSIGWGVGACQGAALAAKDSDGEEPGGTSRRTILFEGDGSLQLTVQEISTMMKHMLDVILFVICNDGYTIERYIHGMDAEYNDVVNWNYQGLVDVFTPSQPASAPSGGRATDNTYKKYQVRTQRELDNLLRDRDFNERGGLRFVELYMPKQDAPKSLKLTAEASAKNNAKDA